MIQRLFVSSLSPPQLIAISLSQPVPMLQCCITCYLSQQFSFALLYSTCQLHAIRFPQPATQNSYAHFINGWVNLYRLSFIPFLGKLWNSAHSIALCLHRNVKFQMTRKKDIWRIKLPSYALEMCVLFFKVASSDLF